MKKINSLFLILIFVLMPVSAKNLVNSKAKVNTEFSIINETIDTIEFSPNENIKISRNVDIPPKANIKAQIVQFQKERRWHKSGFLVCKLLSFTLEGITVDISQYDAYLIAKRYEPINKKEAIITAAEIIIMQGASFFAPGVDIGYFFLKGAIMRKKHPNWFKAGVMNAYDNSICWFWLKGKPIDLSKNDEIKLKYIEPLEARDLSAKIKYKKDKISFKKERKIIKTEVKEINKECKREIKNQNILLAKEEKQAKIILKEQQKMVRIMQKTAKRRAQIAQKNRNK